MKHSEIVQYLKEGVFIERYVGYKNAYLKIPTGETPIAESQFHRLLRTAYIEIEDIKPHKTIYKIKNIKL